MVKSPAKQQIPDTTAQASKQFPRPLGTGSTSTMAARPKQTASHRKLDISRAPRKISPQPKKAAPSTPSPQLNAIPDMMDIDIPERYISPRGLQMWKELLDPLDTGEMDDTPRQAHTEEDGGSGSFAGQVVSKTLFKSAGVTKQQQKSPKRLPRRRLIDSLVEQTVYQDEIEDDETNLEDSTIIQNLNPEPGLTGAHD